MIFCVLQMGLGLLRHAVLECILDSVADVLFMYVGRRVPMECVHSCRARPFMLRVALPSDCGGVHLVLAM